MDGGFREWLAGLGRREMALLVLVGLALVGGAGLWYVRSLPQPVEVRAGPVAAVPSPSPATLFVHVAGWVRRPGVYELREGDRVIDAIERAGGPKKGADLGGLNLAALLVDAQQVLVPRAAPAGVPAGTVPPAGESPGAPTLVNVNVATAEELETLPGIGEVLAAAIIQYREEHGPFTSVDQLVEVSGIGEVTLEEIRDLVTV
ncbi:MAG TPA: ComEA family DNA-binding protein [Actinomycetota bacterium]|nr:ComEA family DNA-binding protein [Actinomycetota bacterium]